MGWYLVSGPAGRTQHHFKGKFNDAACPAHNLNVHRIRACPDPGKPPHNAIHGKMSQCFADALVLGHLKRIVIQAQFLQ